jgi:two-component system, NarL family, nitrate/nitrite response regulator NarL
MLQLMAPIPCRKTNRNVANLTGILIDPLAIALGVGVMINLIRTAVIDDHPMFRDGVAKLLARTPGIEVVAVGSTAADAVGIAREFQPDILLIEIKMADDGAVAVATIAREHPGTRLMILTVSDDASDVTAMLQLGVHGYLLKGCTGQDIVRAVQRVHAGELCVTPVLAPRLLNEGGRREAAEDLSSREEIILAQVSKGLTNKEIARALNLREKTVKHYMTHIMQKLGVGNRCEVAAMGQKRQRTSEPIPQVAPERSACG